MKIISSRPIISNIPEKNYSFLSKRAPSNSAFPKPFPKPTEKPSIYEAYIPTFNRCHYCNLLFVEKEHLQAHIYISHKSLINISFDINDTVAASILFKMSQQ